MRPAIEKFTLIKNLLLFIITLLWLWAAWPGLPAAHADEPEQVRRPRRYGPAETPSGLSRQDWAQIVTLLNQQPASLPADGGAGLDPLAIDPLAQQAYLKASNTGSGDGFGYSVGVSGDTVVVGAVSEASSAVGVNGNQADNSARFAGAAYVFVRSGGVWSQQAYLKASNTGWGDGFGESVAVSGDTIVVGAPYEASSAVGVNGNQADNSVPFAGAAYIFVRSGGSGANRPT
jgi:hypothetical protein